MLPTVSQNSNWHRDSFSKNQTSAPAPSANLAHPYHSVQNHKIHIRNTRPWYRKSKNPWERHPEPCSAVAPSPSLRQHNSRDSPGPMYRDPPKLSPYLLNRNHPEVKVPNQSHRTNTSPKLPDRRFPQLQPAIPTVHTSTIHLWEPKSFNPD